MHNELENYKGVAQDTRTPEEKEKDYQASDILGGAVTEIKWEEKTSWTTLSLRKQITSSSCGAQSLAKILEYFNKDVMSATPPYHFRANYPGEGMYAKDIGEVAKKKTTTEALCPSQNMTEVEMNAANIPENRPFGISAYYFLPIDMDMIATALEKGHGVIFGIGSHIAEWTEIPQVIDGKLTFSHFVACVPKNYLLYKGEKAVVIDDSVNAYSTLNGTGQRILTEKFLKNRAWAALAIVPEVKQEKPVYTFTKSMVYGDRGEEVKKLQQVLIYEGLLKSGLDTGYFGGLTLKAVMAFQLKYKDKILKPAGIGQPSGKVLKYTQNMLNELYSVK